MDYLLSIMEDTRKNWRQFHQYFYVIEKYLTIGYQECRFVISRSIIARVIDYYMGEYSKEVWEDPTKRINIANGNDDLDLSNLMNILQIAVCSCHNYSSEKGNLRPITSLMDPLLNFTEKDASFLLKSNSYNSLIRQCHSVDCNIKITVHLSWEDMEKSEWMIERMDDLIFYVKNDLEKKVFPFVTTLLSVDDSIQAWRINKIIFSKRGLIGSVQRLSAQKQYNKALELLNYLLSQIYSNPAVAGYFIFMGDILEKDIDLYYKDNIKRFELKYLKRYALDNFLQLRDFTESYTKWRKYFDNRDAESIKFSN